MQLTGTKQSMYVLGIIRLLHTRGFYISVPIFRMQSKEKIHCALHVCMPAMGSCLQTGYGAGMKCGAFVCCMWCFSRMKVVLLSPC